MNVKIPVNCCHNRFRLWADITFSVVTSLKTYFLSNDSKMPSGGIGHECVDVDMQTRRPESQYYGSVSQLD